MNTGVRAGTLHQGTFKVSSYNFLEGAVQVPAFGRPLVIRGRENINRTISGDLVVVELLPADQWAPPSARIVDEEALGRNDNPEPDRPEAIETEQERRALLGDAADDDARRLQSQSQSQSESQSQPQLQLQSESQSQSQSQLQPQPPPPPQAQPPQAQPPQTQPLNPPRPPSRPQPQPQPQSEPQPTARVVGIIKRNWRYYVGHIEPSSASAAKTRGPQTVFVRPMDRHIPKIRIRTRQAGELLGQRVVVAIDAWDRTSRYPAGHFVRALGALETRAAETEALLLEHDVQYRPFPQAVLACLPPEGHAWRVPPKPGTATATATGDPRWKGRADYRSKPVCSIDPPGCQDIDDALHALPLANGNFEVGVHIADVTHFVAPDTPMDAEAAARGTTVYLVDKRIDMLPMLLGTDLCSLKPHVERFAFSAVWELTPDADVVSVGFAKSVIASRAAFSYEQAQNRIDDLAAQDELTAGMRTLLALATKLRRRRMAAGALNLASPELRIEAGAETSSDPIAAGANVETTGVSIDVKTKALLATNSLVEEFMLLANTAVAGRIYAAFPQTAMLRRHGAPPQANFEELQRQLLERKGFVLRVDSSKALADSLDTCVDPAEPFFNTLVRILATRCMRAAEYFCSGSLAQPEFCHYGLASPIYTHFTSPIRRYADVVAHRQLAAAIGFADHPSLRSPQTLEAVCQNINVRHRNAQMAGRASVDYYVGQALRGRTARENAFVLRVFANGIAVFVPCFGLEGVIRARYLVRPAGDGDGASAGDAGDGDSDAQDPPTEYDADRYTLTVGSGARRVQLALFEKVRVEIADACEPATGKRKVLMRLV